MQAGLAPHVSMLEVSLPQSAYLDILCMPCLHLVNGIVQNFIHLQQSGTISAAKKGYMCVIVSPVGVATTAEH